MVIKPRKENIAHDFSLIQVLDQKASLISTIFQIFQKRDLQKQLFILGIRIIQGFWLNR